MISAGVYIHIPFCAGKCPYCDFYSVNFEQDLKDKYIAALCREIKKTPGRPKIDTVYFGGGTPSLLTGEDFKLLLSAVSEAFELSPASEITAELNAGDCSEEYLHSLLCAGINRASIGIQSLSNEGLRLLGRRHSAEQAKAAIKNARLAGFKNVSADLMMALPNQKPEDAAADAAGIAELGAEHISVYILKISEGTPFYKSTPAGLPGEDGAADIYLAVCDALEGRGYSHYEISNFARPGFEGRHNLKYWRCADYYGFGAAAAGCVNRQRYRYSSSIADYIAGKPPTDEGTVDKTDYIICSLRTKAGLDPAELEGRFGYRFDSRKLSRISRYIEAGYIERRGGTLRLTDRGFLVSNSILVELI